MCSFSKMGERQNQIDFNEFPIMLWVEMNDGEEAQLLLCVSEKKQVTPEPQTEIIVVDNHHAN